MNPAFEVVDAFVDGERVDPAALTRALEDPAGRAYFVDAWLIRDGVQDELAVEETAPPPRQVPASRRPWLLAVSAAVICLAIGYAVGNRVPRAGVPDVPAAIPTVVDVKPAPVSFPAPAPTRVIRLELAAASTDAGGGD